MHNIALLLLHVIFSTTSTTPHVPHMEVKISTQVIYEPLLKKMHRCMAHKMKRNALINYNPVKAHTRVWVHAVNKCKIKEDDALA